MAARASCTTCSARRSARVTVPRLAIAAVSVAATAAPTTSGTWEPPGPSKCAAPSTRDGKRARSAATSRLMGRSWSGGWRVYLMTWSSSRTTTAPSSASSRPTGCAVTSRQTSSPDPPSRRARHLTRSAERNGLARKTICLGVTPRGSASRGSRGLLTVAPTRAPRRPGRTAPRRRRAPPRGAHQRRTSARSGWAQTASVTLVHCGDRPAAGWSRTCHPLAWVTATGPSAIGSAATPATRERRPVAGSTRKKPSPGARSTATPGASRLARSLPVRRRPDRGRRWPRRGAPASSRPTSSQSPRRRRPGRRAAPCCRRRRPVDGSRRAGPAATSSGPRRRGAPSRRGPRARPACGRLRPTASRR